MQTFSPASASCLDFGETVISWRYLQARTPPPDAAEALCDHCGLRVHRASAGSARRRDRARGSARGCPPIASSGSARDKALSCLPTSKSWISADGNRSARGAEVSNPPLTGESSLY
jgi:hypothetical protein